METEHGWTSEAPANEIVTFTGHLEKVRGVAFSPDGQRLGSVGAESTARIWDATNAVEIQRFQGHTREGISDVAFSPDGRRLASAGVDRTVRIWKVAD